MKNQLPYILIPVVLLSLIVVYFLLMDREEQPVVVNGEEEITQQEVDEVEGKKEEQGECQDLAEECKGGILAYIGEDGEKLIVSAVNNAEDIQWGCRGQLLGGTSREYGTGLTNTQRLVSWHEGWKDPWFIAPTGVSGYCHEKNDGTVAARLCHELDLNGYTDWYLPSIDELELIYENVHKNRRGDFGDSECWSSSEFSEGSGWIKSFLNGNEYGYQKTFNRAVRCVRME